MLSRRGNSLLLFCALSHPPFSPWTTSFNPQQLLWCVKSDSSNQSISNCDPIPDQLYGPNWSENFKANPDAFGYRLAAKKLDLLEALHHIRRKGSKGSNYPYAHIHTRLRTRNPTRGNVALSRFVCQFLLGTFAYLKPVLVKSERRWYLSRLERNNKIMPNGVSNIQ